MIDGEITLGEFIVDTQILQMLGGAFMDIYNCLLMIEESLPALRTLLIYMNIPLEFERTARMHKHRSVVGRRMATAIAGEGGAPDVDQLPIIIQDIALEFDLAHIPESCNRRKSLADVKANSQKEMNAAFRGSLEVQQGTVVCFVGPHGQGKSMLLQILGGTESRANTNKGMLFIPPHLNVLHVALEPFFLRASLFENLTFGDQRCSVERALAVCRRLGVRETILKLMHSKDPFDWKSILSLSELCLLNLARAFIANPNVLLIHKPTMVFNHQKSVMIMEMIRSFVNDRGIEVDPNRHHQRKPRTCIITGHHRAAAEMSDVVYFIRQGEAMRKVRKDEVSAMMAMAIKM